jgi:hypothetical protein
MASYLDILRPQVLTQVVRQVVASADPILNFMGMQPGGANEKFFGHGREGVFHVFDDSRQVAKGRAPGTPAARSSKQVMKQVPFVYPRMHDSVSLLAEFVHNLGKIADPAMRDEAGKDMIMRQTDMIQRRAANWRIAMVVGMLRDQLYIHQEGDDWFPNYTSGSALFQINHRVPAGNKSQLNMTDRAGTSVFSANIIDASWDNAGANIPMHIAKINQARAVQGVGPVTDVLLNSVLWQSVIANDFLCAQAGISNPPFQTFDREVGKRPDGSPLHEYIGKFNALPGITWHISDEGLELWNASTDTYAFTKHFADTMAIFMADPKARADGFTLYQGSEPIAEFDGGPESVRVGLSSWSKKTANPTATEIYVLDNALPVNHDPYSVDIGTVVF